MKKKRMIAITLTAVLVSSSLPVMAENTKQEQVYVVTDAEGTVKSITDHVRLENMDAADELVDRTVLKDIQNLGGQETCEQDGEVLTWQALGEDILYQGTSDQTPAILPVVTITLDGEKISAADLKEAAGDVVLTVTYQTATDLPALAVTALPLPEEGVSDLIMQNAAVVSELGRQILVGWSVPGMDESLDLPVSFSASFHADHADLSWMMTIITSDPIRAACEKLDEQIDTEGLDLHTELAEAQSVLTALRDGEELPKTTGRTKEYVSRISELNTGLTDLNDGAATLADGASQLADGAAGLEEGAASLDDGLATLIANDEALNSGAQTLFTAILDTANAQLADAGLDAAGISITDLTTDNYAEQLDQALTQLDPDTLRSAAAAQVEESVRPQVEANEEQIRAGVEEAVQNRVLEAILEKTGHSMSAEDYQQALDAGEIPDALAVMVSAAVKSQMGSEEVAATVEENIQEQVDQLVAQHVEEYLTSDETVSAKLAQAQAAYESLAALKDQLDQVNSFVSGLQTYTEGAEQAAAGAASLHTGATQLSTGAATLSEGAASLQTDGTQKLSDTLLEAEKEAAEKLLPYVENDLFDALRIFEDTSDQAKNGCYDLCSDDMRSVTVYIIRTDL
ncbi:MAG: hypothetical protein IKG67_03850 [Parasporobacterium sp.]|nr:hypothetical protein [Parasporobacterium sp.]